MDATEIDKVINNVVNFQAEETVQKEALCTSIEESIPQVQEVAVQKKPPSTSMQESVPTVQEKAVKIVGPSTLVPSLPVKVNEQEGNATFIPQLPVHPEKSTIKTRKQQTFYEWLFAPFTG
ncbi:hypothetical protein D8674_005390 [Pyrus ussuriensis x Pyrus communis]|uniref:Uncharacterized protein n=1 Tax=Pyrus ussuriensis x Pyrus communis TaxID=2448454 RepID=A0A5N5FRQ3_9ROSA|nr:hypothetical protein D8674_005390 [Pyrus ussuriensis x Pyrus communis]